jgi:hypothetical protein
MATVRYHCVIFSYINTQYLYVAEHVLSTPQMMVIMMIDYYNDIWSMSNCVYISQGFTYQVYTMF